MRPPIHRAPLRSSRARHARGFTLVEAMVVVGIVVTLTALAGTAVLYGLNRARAHNAAFGVTAMFTLAQTRAVSTGEDHYVAVWQQPDPDDATRPFYGATLFTLPVGAPVPTWRDLDWRDPDSFGATVHESVQMDRGDQVTFVPLASAGLGNTKLPAPFSAVSLVPSGPSGLMAACSFCEAGSSVVGVVRYRPSGEVDFAKSSTLMGGAVAMGEGVTNTDTQRKARLVAIAAPAGAVKVYER